ncbi:MAG: DUF1501 domain-containing protein, partial [Limisphaerales bacterium]
MKKPTHADSIHRRAFLLSSASGLGGVAFNRLLADELLTRPGVASNGLSPHIPAKAKSCIFIFMAGAPSQLDLFDYKPVLNAYHGQPLPESLSQGARFAFLQKESARLMGSSRTFTRHGQSGLWLSDLLPKLGSRADDLCMIQSMHTDQFNHHPGQLMMQCGQAQFGLPSMGSWISYGLGSENKDLPSYVVLTSGRGSSGGATLWQHGFLPSEHAGVLFGNQGAPILNLERPEGASRALDRELLDTIGAINGLAWQAKGDPEILSRIANYELA